MERVLHCFGSLNRGGIQSFVMSLYRKIDREQIQFDFLLLDSKGNDDYKEEVLALGGRCYYICPRHINFLKNWIELEHFFKQHSEYKTLHYHMSSCSYSKPIEVAHKCGYKKIIMHAHSTKQTGNSIHTIIHKVHQKKCVTLATDYFACSDKAGKWLFGKYKNFQIINNGIDCVDFIYSEKVRKEIREELQIGEKRVIGHVGRFVEPKNHELLIDIFREYHERNNNSHLVLVGNGELYPIIQKKVEEYQLKSHVSFLGARGDISRILQGFDLFLMPSLFEGFPVTLVEAQAASVPCVVSENITRQAKILEEVKYVSLDASLNDWCEAIDEMLILNNRRDTSKQIIEAGFDCNSVAKELSKIYMKK